MIPPIVSSVLVVFLALLGGLVVPWLAMSALAPTLEASERLAVTNYRGRRVVAGLGLVWVVWAIGVFAVGTALSALASRSWDAWVLQPSSAWLDPGALPFVLVLGAFALGLADDLFGDAAEKGFRGHLRALTSGRLSTGSLKLVGIGVLALASAPFVADFGAGTDSQTTFVVAIALEALAIALTANLVNLTDLRPGRALKVYSALVVGLLVGWGVRLAGTGASWAEIAVAFAVFLGPVIAVWRLDLGERAMLGDAGANAAGALAGWLACVVLDTWWPLAAYVGVLLILNLASEKFSFSAVIEKNAALSWLDGLGRLHDDPSDDGESEKSSSDAVITEK